MPPEKAQDRSCNPQFSAGLRLVLLCAALSSTACVNMKSMWNGFLDPSQVGHFGSSPLPGEIRKTLTIHDDPTGVPGAEDPRPEDLQVTVEDYRLGAGDTVQITIYQLLERQRYEPFQRTISESGGIELPAVGWIDGVAGMTQREFQQEIVNRLIDNGILAEPIVDVVLLDRRQRTFSVSGGVAVPGEYAIRRTDFRLIDAMIVAGGADPDLKEAYVYRAIPAPDRAESSSGDAGPDSTTQPAADSQGAVSFPAEMADGAGGAPDPNQSAEPQRSVTGDAERELLEAATPTVPRAAPGASSEPPAARTRWEWKGGQWREVAVSPGGEAPAESSKRETGPEVGPPSFPVADAEDRVDWEALASAGRQRIIRIPLGRLRNGDVRYNIVIHPGDRIWLPLGQIGDFYVMGQVNAPGVYSLTRRKVTLRQAIAASGGLSQLAWPTRCEIIRRVGGDREVVIPIDLSAIFDGKAEDFLLRPDDVLNVGTSAAAPFLASIRSAFRVAYGFGFVYDRNFADIDSFAGQQNPTDRRRFERQRRFPGLF